MDPSRFLIWLNYFQVGICESKYMLTYGSLHVSVDRMTFFYINKKVDMDLVPYCGNSCG